MKRYIIAGILSAVCAAGTTLGISTAFLTETHGVKNQMRFVGDGALDCELMEPSWDEQQAVNMVPGMMVLKDPQITNTSESDLDEAVALRAEFVYGRGCPVEGKAGTLLTGEDMQSVLRVFTVNWNAEEGKEWIRYTGEDATMAVQHFFYGKLLKRKKKEQPQKGETTVPLFTMISIGEDVKNEEFQKIQEFGGFEIRISGCAVQQIESEEQGESIPQKVYEAGLFTFPA